MPGVTFRVELEGVEPSSKQGNPALSTRLFRFMFSCGGKTRTTNRRLILFVFAAPPRRLCDYSRLAAPLYQEASGREFLSDVSSSYLVRG